MAELTSVERVLRVLRNEEPDRIPHFEWIIDHHVREAIIPGCTMEEFTVRMGLDAILTGPDFRKEQIGEKRYRNEWGVVSEYTGEEHSYPGRRADPDAWTTSSTTRRPIRTPRAGTPAWTGWSRSTKASWRSAYT